MKLPAITISLLASLLFSHTSLLSLDISSVRSSTNTKTAEHSFSSELDSVDATLDQRWEHPLDLSQSAKFTLEQSTPVDVEKLLEVLRKRSDRLGQGLFETQTGEECPIGLHSPFFSWEPSPEAVCYDATSLEQDIASLMRAYKETAPLAADEADKFLIRFGNKHKNLIKMSRLVDDLQLEGVVVPKPRGIASASIESFLRSAAPEIFDSWQVLGELYDNHQGEDFFQQQTSIQHFDVIDTALTKAFTDPEAKFITQELHSWLKELQEKEQYLMVRSTGAEDSKALANAGGNASVSYVEPSIEAILKPIATVVRSYFGVSSLQNRINAGRNPFAEELRFSVTLQELVGESIDSVTSNTPPKSLVLFSNEPLYIGREAFRILRLSGAYGHGDGVVGNFGIATDTILILNSVAHPDQLYIIYDRQHKIERLAPQREASTGAVSLGKVRNSEEMAKAPLLNVDEMIRLYQLAIVMEAFFDDVAIDMEIVIKEGVIYPVQARPVNRPLQLPTYIDMQAVGKLALSPVTKSFKLEVLVPGVSSVITLSSTEQLLIATTLEEAERHFVSGLHRAVVVGQPEPANSHPVVNFSALGVPCFYMHTTRSLEEALAKMSTEQQAFICVQGALFGCWDTSEASVNDYILQGYARHPANIALSLYGDTPFKGLQSPVPEDLHAQLTALRHVPTHEKALEIIENIAAHPWITRLAEVREALAKEAYTYPDLPQEVFKSLHMLQDLEETIQASFEEIEAYFSLPQSKQRLQPLFHIKVLEALLDAPNRRLSSLGQVCLADVTLITQRIQEMIDYRKELGKTARLADLLHLGSEAITKEGYQQWRQLLMRFERAKLSHEEEAGLRRHLEIMQRTRSLPMMMTLTLPHFSSNESSPQEKLNNLLSTLTEADNELVETVFSLEQEINSLAHKLDAFADPAHFDEVWTELIALSEAVMQPKFLEQYTLASPTGKGLALHSMADVVDIFDRSIKTVKASPQWETREKVQQIKDMLLSYFRLFQVWIDQLVPHHRIPTNPDWPVNTYLHQLESLVNAPSPRGIEQLNSSPDFSVAAAVLGSSALFNSHQPKTVEDLFTLIHQNLLMSVGILNTDQISNQVFEQANLPELVKLAIEALNTTTQIRANRIGVDFSDQGIDLLYNIPLRDHSGQLTLKYNKYSATVSLQLQLLGKARQRWDLAAELAMLEELAQNALLDKPLHISGQEFRVSWSIGSESALTRALEIVNYMCNEISMMQDESLEAHYVTVIEEQSSEQLLQRVSAYVNSDISRNRQVATKVITHYIRLGGELEGVIEIAERVGARGLLNNDWIVRSWAEKLFQALFEKGHGFEAAEGAAARGVLDDGWFTRSLAIELFQDLVEKDHGFEGAEGAAAQGMLDSDSFVRLRAFELFEDLFEKDYGFKAAEEAAAQGIVDDDLFVRSTALKLFQTLVEKDHSFEAAEKAAAQGVLHDERHVRSNALSLFHSLVREDHSFEAAEKAAAQGIVDDEVTVRLEALELFQILVEKDHSFEAAEEAAAQGVLDDSSGIRRKARNLLKALKNTAIR